MQNSTNYPLISVVVPAHNEEKLIGRCLEAIRNQDYINKEIIVVDNGSQDKTADVARTIADIVLDEPSSGVAKARNKGANMAKGDIIVFIDADTFMPQGLLKNVYQAINSGYIAGSVRFKRDLGNKPDIAMYLQNLVNQVFLYKLHIINPCSYTPCVFCTKEAFMKTNGFPEDLIATEEIRFLGKLKKLGKIKFLSSKTVLTSPRRKDYILRPLYLFCFPKSKQVQYRDNIR